MPRILTFWLLILIAAPANAETNFVFFGTSTFLVENGKRQILIDAYLSRSKAGVWKKLSPDLQQLKQIIEKFEVCPSKNTVLQKSDPAICQSGKAARLEWILPLHGHYDHALDAGAMALWSGAHLAGDRSVDAILQASKKLPASQMGLTGWRSAVAAEMTTFDPLTDQLFESSKTRLVLFPTPHGKNPFSPFLKGQTSLKIKFPASVFAMKEGQTRSAHLVLGNKSYLFIPSAGNIGDAISKRKLKADIVFLGIGGTCSRKKKWLKNYWNDTAIAASAKRVYLIHWDNSLGINPDPHVRSQPYRRCLMSRVKPIFEKLATTHRIKILTPPFETRFDPYIYE